MKLKTKLVIVFMVVMVFPMLFNRSDDKGICTGKGNGDPADVSDRRIHHGSIVDHMDLSCGISAAAKITESGKEYQRRKSGF